MRSAGMPRASQEDVRILLLTSGCQYCYAGGRKNKEAHMDAHKLEHLFSMLSCQPPACISWEDSAPAGAVMPPEGRHACIINYLRMAWTQAIRWRSPAALR